MINLTTYQDELLWLKNNPESIIDYWTGEHHTYFNGNKLDLTTSMLDSGKTPVNVGINQNGNHCFLAWSVNPNFKGIRSSQNDFVIAVRRTRIYLIIFGEKIKDNKKYKFDIDWNPLTEIPEWLEQQITYLKLKEVI